MNVRRVVAAGALALSAFTAGAHLHTSHSAYLPKCKSEDSSNCIWDAKHSGNHKGRSFIDWHGKVYYIGR